MREYIQAFHLARIADKNNSRGRGETTITTKATTKDIFFSVSQRC